MEDVHGSCQLISQVVEDLNLAIIQNCLKLFQQERVKNQKIFLLKT